MKKETKTINLINELKELGIEHLLFPSPENKLSKDFQRGFDCITSFSTKEKENIEDFLLSTDFTTAPASTRFHCSHRGGLMTHSFNVALELNEITSMNGLQWDRKDSPFIIGLFHDVCKIHTYKSSWRNAKNEETGKWEKVPYYEMVDEMPLGHGEKSLIILLNMVKLTTQEIYCIRWHMGCPPDKDGQSLYFNATRKCPNILYTHLADMSATLKEEGCIA